MEFRWYAAGAGSIRSRARPWIGVACAALALMSGCSGADDSSANTDSASADSTVSASDSERGTTAVDTTSAPATSATAPAPVVFANPAAAGKALFAAWTTGTRDAAGALQLAPSAELDKLFATPARPVARNRGCDEAQFGSASCFFGNDQGGVNVTLAPADGGWSIQYIDPFG